MSDATPWTCKHCGEVYVVPTRARDCEAEHRRAALPPVNLDEDTRSPRGRRNNPWSGKA